MKDYRDKILNKKILVTGGGGVLSSYVKGVFIKNQVILADKKSFDITKKAETRKIIKKVKPDFIFHFAALTNVDLCENDKKMARKINYFGTKNVANVCKLYNIPLVYISTSAVFKGINPPLGGYSEKDKPNPANYYGKTKLAGEKYIKSTLKKYIIVRAGWMIGGAKKEKKFLSYITDKIKEGKTVNVVNDKFGTLTYTKDLLIFIEKLLSGQKYGLFHYGSSGICSRYDIALFVKNIINKKAEIVPVSSNKFTKTFTAPRPKYEILKSKKIPFKTDWKKVLGNYIKEELLF